MHVSELRKQHKRIGELAADLSQLIEAHAEPRPVAALRWQLARELMAHLAIEDRLFYPAMISSRHDAAAQAASAFRGEMGELARLFSTYLSNWSEARIALDWEAFRADTRRILALLEERMRREEDTLYPLAIEVARAA